MARIAPMLGTLGLASAALALMSSVVLAQEASPGPQMGTHPIVGTWLAEEPAGTDVFHADGTLLSITPEGTIAGVWESTGPSSAAVTLRFPIPDGSEGTLRGVVEVSEDGMTYTATYTVELVGADGTSDGQLGPGSGTGSRITVEPMGSPVAPIPVGPGPAASPSPSV